MEKHRRVERKNEAIRLKWPKIPALRICGHFMAKIRSLTQWSFSPLFCLTAHFNQF